MCRLGRKKREGAKNGVGHLDRMKWGSGIKDLHDRSSGISIQANPTVMVIQQLGENSIQTIGDSSDVLRHIIKHVSKEEME